jgi:hypothetical protein
MNYEQFKSLIETTEKVRERSSAIYDLGLDLINFEDSYYKIINILMNSIFDEEGHGWIDWYLYERIGFDSKVKLATDKDGNEICYDIPSLWETVKEHLTTK